MIRFGLLFILLIAHNSNAIGQFVSTNAEAFQLNNRTYTFIGTNYWYGSLLGLERDKTRGVDRLRKELDFLKSNGVTNLRLMAGAEGSGVINGVTRVGPPLQPTRGVFDEHALDGLDLILTEMSKRGMKAVIFLSNNWEWSGGFQQYVDWNGLVPDELNGRALNWDELRNMVARFYVCAECKAGYIRQVRFVLSRTNKINARKYIDDPTIMAWELANEPRPMRPGSRERYVEWIRDAAAVIKAIDPKHLVTIGHEGSIGTEGMDLFEQVHRDPNIDYLTIHIWAKNWEWFKAGRMAADFPIAIQKATNYIEEHIAVARRLRKPLVIEEFGLPRDELLQRGEIAPPIRRDAEFSRVSHIGVFEMSGRAGNQRHCPSLSQRLCVSAVNFLPQTQRDYLSLAPGTPTNFRDKYFKKIFSYVGRGPVAGANFWAFGGTARPVKGQMFWKAGDEWMGDPPMEEQGLNTVFDVDVSTWRIIRSFSLRK